jgi:hypothetical protein
MGDELRQTWARGWISTNNNWELGHSIPFWEQMLGG